jgi:hypothetical protein
MIFAQLIPAIKEAIAKARQAIDAGSELTDAHHRDLDHAIHLGRPHRYTSSLPSCLAHTTGAQPSRAEPTEFAHLLILSPLCLSIAESIRTVSRACVSA